MLVDIVPSGYPESRCFDQRRCRSPGLRGHLASTGGHDGDGLRAYLVRFTDQAVMGEPDNHDAQRRQCRVPTQVALTVQHAAVVLAAVQFEVEPPYLVVGVEVHGPLTDMNGHLPAQPESREDVG